MIKFPKNISFEMTASTGDWKGSFGIKLEMKRQKAKIRATILDPSKGIYKVIMIAPKPYSGPYEYRMSYDILKQWENNAQSGSWYNNNIRGNTAYFPK